MEQQTAPLVAANGITKSSLKVGVCADAVPSATLQRSSSPGGTPQVRFQVTAARSNRSKQERRRTASSSSHFSDSSSPDDDSVTLERHAPDGGWGWVVVAAAFTVNMIADGICFSFGVLFVEFLRYFGSSKSTTAWLGSIFLALPLLLGPVASSLVDRFGCRKSTIAGSLLSAAGFILSYFADSMEILFITFSIMPGIGLSVCYVSAVVSVAYYFERRRSLATGISVCGTGVGTFLFPPLVEHLLQEYGWRGSLLVLSGIFLNMAVCGMLMRDLDWTKHKNRERSSQCTLSADGDSDSVPADSDSLPDIERLRNALNSGDVVALLGRSGDKDQLDRVHSSALQLPTWLAERDVSPEVLKTIETNRRVHELVCRLYPHLLLDGAAAEDSGRSLPAPPPAPPPASAPSPGSPSPVSAPTPPTSKPVSPPASTPVPALAPALAAKVKEEMEEEGEAEEEAKAEAEAEVERKSEAMENGPVKTKVYDRDVGHTANTGQSADVGDLYTSLPDDASASGGRDGHQSCDVLTSKGDTVVPMTEARVSRSVPHHRHHQLHHQRPSHHHLVPLLTCEPAPSAAYLRNMKLRRQSMTYRGAMLHIQRYRLRASSCPDIYRNSMITITSEEEEEDCCSCFTEMLTALRKMVDPAYFRLPGFVLFAISNFVLYMFYDVPYVYLADHAISSGTSGEDASMLISVIGISNVIGVLLVGYLGDRPSVPGTALYVACMVACGVATLLVPSCDSYSALVAVSSVFGFCISANYTLAPTILVSLISIENFTNAYGLLLLAQGLANLVGPPLCGMLRDLTSTYELTFHAAGAAVIVSGLLLCLARLARAARASHRVLKRVTSTETSTGGSSDPL